VRVPRRASPSGRRRRGDGDGSRERSDGKSRGPNSDGARTLDSAREARARGLRAGAYRAHRGRARAAHTGHRVTRGAPCNACSVPTICCLLSWIIGYPFRADSRSGDRARENAHEPRCDVRFRRRRRRTRNLLPAFMTSLMVLHE
jgi:hypothetical protein